MAPIVRPWRNEAQLIHVGRCFYRRIQAEGRDPRIEACERVQVWQTRGDVPHSVLATSSLMQAVLHDEQSIPFPADVPSAPIAANSIACTYAIALVHFVTGLTDTQQTKKDKLSMYRAAESAGLPPSFVDLRNDIVHVGKLPLLQMRDAAKEALQWLWENYWTEVVSREAEDDSATREWNEMLELERLTRELNAIVSRFASFVREIAAMETSQGFGGGLEKVKAYASEVQQLCSNQGLSLQLFADLLSSVDEFGLAMSKSKASATRGYWHRLVMNVAAVQSNFLLAFSNAMVRCIAASRGNEHGEPMAIWLTWAWVAEEWKSVRASSKIKAEDVLDACLASPNRWTLLAAETLLVKCPAEVSKAPYWKRELNRAKDLLNEDTAL